MKKATFPGGIHILSVKGMTNADRSRRPAPPERVYIPLSQHIGAACKACIEVGRTVCMGEKIGDTDGFVSAPVHSSVSGTIVAIEKRPHPDGRFVDCVVIENDGKDTLDPSVRSTGGPRECTPGEIIEAVREAGIVGLGGATFPTHVKYRPPEGKSFDTVIINGIECEPYITADHRLMLEYPREILRGLQYICQATGATRGILAIEDNKPDAIASMEELAAEMPGVSVRVCREKYPQGAEKQLIVALTGRQVPPGGLPVDVGVVVNNVGTARAICEAVERKMPLIERMITVSGDAVREPANYYARIGTLFKDLILQAGGCLCEDRRIISGGPMMGKTMFSEEMPVTKGTSAILLMKDTGPLPPEHTCVRCAKCLDACPAFLEPTRLAILTRRGEWERLEGEQHITSCIECGSCTYVCPAHIPLLEYIRLGKIRYQQHRSKQQGDPS